MNEFFLFFSLFFPRFTILIAYLTGGIPPNILPLWFEIIMTMVIPRGLVIFYIGTTLGWGSVWVFAHVLAWIIAMFLNIARNVYYQRKTS